MYEKMNLNRTAAAARVAVIACLLLGIMAFAAQIVFNVLNSEKRPPQKIAGGEEKSFVLQKRCNADELKELGKQRGLSDYEIDLLVCRYAQAFTWNQMQAKFYMSGSIRTLQRYTQSAEKKLLGEAE